MIIMAAEEQPIIQPAVAEPLGYQQLVLGDNIIDNGISEEVSLLQVLHWIGFRTAEQRNSIVVADSFTSWEDLKMLTEKDASAMTISFATCSQANSHIIFGTTTRTKYIKALIHWVQDFYRISGVPTIVGLHERTFKQQLQHALTRAKARKNLIDQTSSVADAASPGPLEKESQWKEWEEKFTNYAKAHIRSTTGIPFSYIIRENDNPDLTSDYPDWISKTIACAPLEGEEYHEAVKQKNRCSDVYILSIRIASLYLYYIVVCVATPIWVAAHTRVIWVSV